MSREFYENHALWGTLSKHKVSQNVMSNIYKTIKSSARSIVNGGSCIISPKDLRTKAYNLDICETKLANFLLALYNEQYIQVNKDLLNE